MHRPPGVDHGKRPRRKIDWELIACGWSGHVLFGTDAAELRPEDHLLIREEEIRGHPIRFHRCLRCDSWIALPSPADPARQYPPARGEIVVPLRGKALRDKVVLRVIAIDRVIHFLILMLLGVLVLLIANNQHSVRASFYRVVTDLGLGVGGGPVQNDHVGLLGEFNKLLSLRSGKLRLVGAAFMVYGAMEGIEAIGLWFAKRWAEYLTFLATTILLPLEVYELVKKVSATKLIGFILNLAVVLYLLYAKRLFGLRGGGKVDEEERAKAISWETLEATTPPWEPARVAAEGPHAE
jgi:uncharacterized membrane protein (DUF2068 family)